MLFNSIAFIFFFLPSTVLPFWFLRLNYPRTYALAYLCGLSAIFYWLGEPNYPWLLFVSILMNYGFGRWIHKSEGDTRRWVLAVALAINLLLLAGFKYFNFVAGQFAALGVLAHAPATIILPIGISFFTFTQIAYLADTYQGRVSEKSFLSYLLFVSFYPHLIAGPILHHKEMMPQFRAARAPRPFVDVYSGIAMFAIGLSKKTLVADNVAYTSTYIFAAVASGERVSVCDAWIATLAFAMQIYFDFSAYSDMAIGISQMIGIKLPLNFNSPYKSVSIIEFWRRWHITLSRFLRDYLYIPLGGSRKGKARAYSNLMATMLLGALWHGAGWTFLVWGGIHGIALALAHLWKDARRRFSFPAMPRLLARWITFLVVVVAWVPFRAPDLRTTISVWKSMFGMNGLAMPQYSVIAPLLRALNIPPGQVMFSKYQAITLAIVVLIALFMPNSQEILSRFRMGLKTSGYALKTSRWTFRYRLGWNWQSAAWIGLLLGLGVRAIGGYSEFIYFHF